MSGKYARHQKHLKEAVLYLQDEFKGLRLWQVSTGEGYRKYSVMDALKEILKTRNINAAMKLLSPIKFGIVGHPDLCGIYYGRWIGIEIKTGNAVQSKDQKNFQKMIEDRQGIYIVISNKKTIDEQIKELKDMRELCQ